MKNYTLKNDLEILKSLEINSTQLLILKLLSEAEEDRTILYKLSKEMAELKLFNWNYVADLISRDIILDHNSSDFSKPSPMYFDYMEINPKYLKRFITLTQKAKEVIKIYPRLLEINGKNYNLVNVGYVDLAEVYKENLEFTDFEHEEVLELIKWGKENKQINVGLEKFTKTQYWVILKELKESSGGRSSIKVEML